MAALAEKVHGQNANLTTMFGYFGELSLPVTSANTANLAFRARRNCPRSPSFRPEVAQTKERSCFQCKEAKSADFGSFQRFRTAWNDWT